MTVITRLSTAGLQQASLGDMTRLQSEMGEVQQQISSGKSVSSFQELSAQGQTERVLGFENQVQKANDYIRNNTIITNRAQAYNSSVSNVIDIAEQLRNLLLQRRTPTTANALPFTQMTDSYLSTIKSSLNVEVEGRFLFAGSKTDTQPVDNIETSNITINPATGERTFNSTYYKGDSVKLKTQASDALNIEYGITADDPTFKNLIGAIHLAVEGHNANDDALLAQAVDLASQTITDLSSMQAKVNNNITILDTTNIEHADFKIFLDKSINDVTETDVGEATIRLSSIQTTLQAAFIAYSRISSLKLSDFLN